MKNKDKYINIFAIILLLIYWIFKGDEILESISPCKISVTKISSLVVYKLRYFILFLTYILIGEVYKKINGYGLLRFEIFFIGCFFFKLLLIYFFCSSNYITIEFVSSYILIYIVLIYALFFLIRHLYFKSNNK